MKRKLLIVCSCMALGLAAAAFAGCDIKREETLFGEWTTTQEATCEETGLQTRVSLSDPSVVETRAIPAHGHDWADWEEIVAPSCLVAGVKKRACNTCENEDFAPIPALGHDWGEWITVAEPTCNTDGYATRVCLRDGAHTDMLALPALGHDYGDWVTVKAPTCTTGGIEKRVCRTCNDHADVRAVAALGHDWNELVTIKAPTCTEEGEAKRVCRNDASHTVTESVPVLGHDWSDWFVIKEPTLEEDGEEMRVCANNSAHTETRPLVCLRYACWDYTLNEAGTEYGISLKAGWRPSVVTLHVPSEYNGLAVTEIRGNGVISCKNLKRVEFSGNNLKRIGRNAFMNCIALESIEIPEGVVSVGACAFGMCRNLRSVSFPASVRDFGQDNATSTVFLICPALETITVAAENPRFFVEKGCLVDREKSRVIASTQACEIPDYVKIIGDYAFGQRSVEELAIPDGVEEIGYRSFIHCNHISVIEIPASVRTIKQGAFEGWQSDQTIIVKGFVSQAVADIAWGKEWRLGCRANIIYRGNPEEQILPEGVKTIAIGAFGECVSVKKIVIPASVESVGVGAFSGWTANQTIIIKGFASQAAADAAWGANWRKGCNAKIIYQG